jgi:hypothetical protein
MWESRCGVPLLDSRGSEERAPILWRKLQADGLGWNQVERWRMNPAKNAEL